LVLRKIADAQTLHRQSLSAEQRQLTRDRAQERGFARAVGPEQSDALARQDRPIDTSYNRLARVTQRRVVEFDELSRMRLDCRKRERKWTVDVRGGDQFHAFERLDPALRLLGLGRLGSKAVDKRAKVRDLALLLGESRLLLRQRQCMLALE